MDASHLASLLGGLGLGEGEEEAPPPPPPRQLASFDLDGLAAKISESKNIIVMAGAGISVSAGIPDFRTPGTGLYDNLQKYDLPDPQSIFTVDYFVENPEPFYSLAKELYPGQFAPTPTHYFCKMLAEKGKLLRMYTQNIDSLETIAGLPQDKVVAAHGNFDSARVITGPNKGASVPVDEVKEAILAGEEGWKGMVAKHQGLVKPDIVFFGEGLPERFHTLLPADFKQCDLLIVMGTSLKVQPFASLVDKVGPLVPRALWNREPAGVTDPKTAAMIRKMKALSPQLAAQLGAEGFVFEGDNQYRDVFCEGNCDDTAKAAAEKLGWLGDLEALIAADAAKFRPADGKDGGADAAAAPAAVSAPASAPGPPLKTAEAGDASTEGNELAAAATAVEAVMASGHMSGVWRGEVVTDGAEDIAEPLEWTLSLMGPKVAQGVITAFGCRYTAGSDGGPPTYTALHGKVDFLKGEVSLSSCDGTVVFTADLVLGAASPSLKGRWRDTTARKEGDFVCSLNPRTPGVQAGLWVGEAAPIEALKHEVPLNPVKWCLTHSSDPVDGRPSIYGVGFFDDAGDFPGQPVLFYTLRGDPAVPSSFLKVYEPPVPAVLNVGYTEVALSEGEQGQPMLSGKWENALEGTSGTFTAALQPNGPPL
eukprot:m.129479 g.129479  ORF g.129479 m.129479 type:complete len:649 (+) comp13676_c0_seq1:70-2016(+)